MKTKFPYLILAGLLGTSISSQAATVVWDGSTDTTWTAVSDATSWSGATYNDGDDVEFTGAGGTVTLSGVIDPGSVLVNSSSDYTFAGTSDQLNRISDGGTLTKSGTGTLHFDGRNHTFTGGITLNDGTLSFNNSPRSYIASSPLTVNGGQLDVRLENFTVTELSGSGGEISVYRRTFTVNQDTNTTYAGVIEDFNGVVSSGNGTTFTKGGTGTLTLSGNNTYSKVTTVNNGTLEVSGALYSAGTNGTTSNITVGAAGTLDFTGAGSLGSGAAFDGNITNAGTFNYNSTTDQTLSGIISGAGVLTKDNTSTLTLSGVNTYTGNTTVSAGTLQIGGAGQLGNGDYSGDIAVASGATFQYSSSASGPVAKYQGDISGDGTLIKDSNTGELRLFGNNSIANIEINQGILRGAADANSLGDAGTTISLGDTSGTAAATLAYGGTVNFTTKAGINVRAGSSGTKTIFNINGTVTDNTAITLNDSLTINDNSALTLGGVISGTGGLTKTGTGTTTLTGSNSYTGLTTVNEGTLTLGTSSALSAGSYQINNDATLQTTVGINVGGRTFTFGDGGSGTINFTGGNMRINGTTFVTTGGSTNYISGSLLDLGTPVYDVADGTDAVDLQVSNSHNRAGITKNGAGTLSLTSTANNLQSNPITINAGVLELGGAGRLVNGNYSGNITNDAIFRHNSTNNQNLNGVISGTGAIEKDNTGTLTLTGANTYSGTTTVSNGTLTLSAADNNIANSTSIDVASGATLDVSGITNGFALANGQTLSGAGTVTGGMTIALGSVISPGNSPGTLSTGAQTWNDGGSYLWEINASDDAGGTIGNDPGWDWLDITGALDLTNLTAGGFTIDIDSLTAGNIAGDAVGFDTWTKGSPGDFDYSFTIATASSGISGFDADNFTLDSSGFSNAPGWDWGIVLSGNSLVLQAYALPEPSSSALLGLGGLALMLRRRRS